MSLTWYIRRLQTFSGKEIFYRVSQRLRTHVLDKRLCKKTMTSLHSKWNFEIPPIFKELNLCLEYPIFDKTIDIFKPIPWQKDLSTNKNFPLSFAHSINIRSDEFGSAKYVWEINRGLFLVHLATLYSKAHQGKQSSTESEVTDKAYLDLICFHIADWDKNNPYLNSVNWYSNIEINIRLINWAYVWKLLDAEKLQKENAVFKKFTETVWMPLIQRHVDFSYRHPSRYSSANNHLIAEYAGLFIACRTWSVLPKAKKYARYAQRGLEREIILQNTSEGVNREEAAEYIQFINDFFLMAAIVGDETGMRFSGTYKERLRAMAHYENQILDVNYNYIMYGDGDDGFVLRTDKESVFNNFNSQLTAFAAYFQDAALKRREAAWNDKCELLLGNLTKPLSSYRGRELFENLDAVGNPSGSAFYKKSGHFLFRKTESCSSDYVSETTQKKLRYQEILLHFDAAPLGFLSIAAHGHADALSFTLSVDGTPIFVDPGTFTYHTHKEWRKYFVGTLAHNTIRIQKENQAFLAGPTLWLNHFDCSVLECGQTDEEEVVAATHNGYRKLGISHLREIRFFKNKNEFVITDTITSATKDKYLIEMPFHLHPTVSIQLSETTSASANSTKEISDASFGKTFILQAPNPSRDCARFVKFIPDSALKMEMVRGSENPILGWYSEHFGEKVPTTVLIAKQECRGNVRFVTRLAVCPKSL